MITSIIRFSYLSAWEPKKTPSGDLKYSASLLIPKTDEKGVKEIKAAINAAVQKGIDGNKFSQVQAKAPKFHNPLRDGDEEFEAGNRGPEYKGHYFLNSTSTNQPGIVGPDAKPLFDPEDLYSGCYGRADINFFPFKHAANVGIGVGLNNLMKVKDGERLDGRMKAEDAFAQFSETPAEEGDLE